MHACLTACRPACIHSESRPCIPASADGTRDIGVLDRGSRSDTDANSCRAMMAQPPRFSSYPHVLQSGVPTLSHATSDASNDHTTASANESLPRFSFNDDSYCMQSCSDSYVYHGVPPAIPPHRSNGVHMTPGARSGATVPCASGVGFTAAAASRWTGGVPWPLTAATLEPAAVASRRAGGVPWPLTAATPESSTAAADKENLMHSYLSLGLEVEAVESLVRLRERSEYSASSAKVRAEATENQSRTLQVPPPLHNQHHSRQRRPGTVLYEM
jgi:hypothetical protein